MNQGDIENLKIMLIHWFKNSDDRVSIHHAGERATLEVRRIDITQFSANLDAPGSFTLIADQSDLGWWVLSHRGGSLRYKIEIGVSDDLLADSRLWIYINADPSWRIVFAASPRRSGLQIGRRGGH
jgi:hypothetical protein